MENEEMSRKAFLAALGVAGLGVLSFLGIRTMSNKPDESYQAMLSNFYENKNMHTLNVLLTDLGSEVIGLMPEEIIIGCGYKPLNTNAASYDDAQLVILGDMHTMVTPQLFMILDNLVKKDDIAMIEQSPGTNDVDARKLESLDNLEEKAKLFFGFQKNMEYMVPLIAKSKGVIVGVDQAEDGKDGVLTNMVERTVLDQVRIGLELKHLSKHPFIEWMLYDNLKIAKKGASVKDLSKAVQEYYAKVEHKADVSSYNRQQAILDNVSMHVKSVPQGSRCFLTIGLAHINQDTPNMLSYLEANGIRYVAFVPDGDRTFVRKQSSGAFDEEASKYFEILCKQYAEVKGRQGVKKYEGSFEGIVDRKFVR
jgi:hypothetical protein